MGSPNVKFKLESNVLHDPDLLRSRGAQARQLHFPFEEGQRPSGGSRPVTIKERHADDLNNFREHVLAQADLWQGLEVRAAGNGANVDQDQIRLTQVFASLVHRAQSEARDLDPQLRQQLVRGLKYLASELQSLEMDHAKFRSVWSAVWPLVNDYGWLEQNEGSMRAALQRVLAKGF